MLDFPIIKDLSPNVIAAAAAALATLVAAFINMRISWRREVLDRIRSGRGSKRTRRGLLIAIVIMVTAAGVGGYAAALYQFQNSNQQIEALRTDLQQRIAQIQDTALRLESARTGERESFANEAQIVIERRRGGEGAAAAARLAPCRARTAAADAGAGNAANAASASVNSQGAVATVSPTTSSSSSCGEADAPRVALCAVVPAAATVYDVVLFARFDGDNGAWNERRVALGAELGNARFARAPFERVESDAAKEICVDAWSWSDRALDARIVARYLMPEAGTSAPLAAQLKH